MIDHFILTVSDFKRSVVFYTKALKPLGITNFTDYEGQDGHPDLLDPDGHDIEVVHKS
jgi:catechol 2,3-dioxygenase-like lactoylglutathione lyase family enzyme